MNKSKAAHIKRLETRRLLNQRRGTTPNPQAFAVGLEGASGVSGGGRMVDVIFVLLVVAFAAASLYADRDIFAG